MPIPELGETITIRSLTERERSAYEAETLLARGAEYEALLESARRRLFVLVVVDPVTRELMFGPLDADDLQDADCLLTSRVHDAALQHCGFERRAIEDLVKNSVEIAAAA